MASDVSDRSSATAVEGLPVALALAGPHAVGVRTWVEGVAGWQPVDRDGDPLVPPLLVLADVPGRAQVRGDLPVVLLVGDGDQAVAAAAAAVGVAATLQWPHDRERLPTVAAALVGHGRQAADATARDLRIAGAAGGVGTTTVALALAGLVAWRGLPTLVVTHGAVPVPTTRTLDVADLAGAGTWDVATPATGLSRLRVVRATEPPSDGPIDAGAARAVIRDIGVSEDGDVLVLRRDAAGLAALGRTAAGVAIVVDSGVAPARAVRGAAAGRRLVVVEWSQRVARAALAQRVPAGLPGRWLRTIGAALEGGA